MTVTPQQLLEETARRVEAGEWGPKWDGPCVMALVNRAALDRRNEFAFGDGSMWAVSKALNAISCEIGGGMVSAWNDEPGRLKEEVAAVVWNSKRWL